MLTRYFISPSEPPLHIYESSFQLSKSFMPVLTSLLHKELAIALYYQLLLFFINFPHEHLEAGFCDRRAVT